MTMQVIDGDDDSSSYDLPPFHHNISPAMAHDLCSVSMKLAKKLVFIS